MTVPREIIRNNIEPPVISIPRFSLRRNFIFTFFGNLIYGFSQWSIIMALAKLGSPEIIGQFSLGLAICTPVVLFFNLQLRTLQATDAKEEYGFSQYFVMRIITSLFAFCLISGLVFIGDYTKKSAIVILLIGVLKIIDSMSDLCYGKIQFNEQMDRIAISMMFRGIIGALVLSVLYNFTKNLALAVIGMIATGTIVFLSYDLRNVLIIQKGKKLSLKKKNKLINLVNLALCALPLGIVSMLVSLNSNIPRYFIQKQLGEWELGIYSAIAQFMVAGVMFVMALGQTISPRLAKYIAYGKINDFQKLLKKSVFFGIVIGALGVSFSVIIGKEILTIFYSPEYAKNHNLLIVLMLSAGLAYINSFLGYGITAARLFKIQLPISIMAACACLFSSIYLIPRYGLNGAAVAVLTSQIINLIALTCVATFGIKQEEKITSA